MTVNEPLSLDTFTTCMSTLTEQRYERLAHAPHAEKVRLKRLAHGVEARALGALPSVVEDGSVVDERVEPAEPLLDQMLCGIHALLFRHV